MLVSVAVVASIVMELSESVTLFMTEEWLLSRAPRNNRKGGGGLKNRGRGRGGG